tara:strand:+ start:250 stop:1065 length:816 start_codon:yes stop_codon:yes gene_type:complete
MALGTAAAIAGIASSAIGTGMSFAQAQKQKKAMASADAKAANYMAKARERLEVNYMDELAINKEPYQRQREAMLVAGAQAQQASVEGSTRGAAANTGRILAAQQQAQGDIRDQMNRDMFNLEAASAEEDSRLRDINTQLDMGEISGAQQQSAQASAARQQAIQQGIQGAVSTVEGAIAMPDLYRKDLGAQRSALSKTGLDQSQFQEIGNIGGGSMGEAAGAGFTNLDLDAVGEMNNRQFRQFKRALTPEQSRMLFYNKDYTNNYNNTFSPY